MIGNALCERQRARHQLAFDHLIEQCRLRQFFGGYRRAGNDHVQRHFQTEHTWQTLRTASARQDAKFDFGQRDLRARGSNPVMTAQCQLESTTHADRMDRCDDGLAGVFDHADQTMQRRLGKRARRIEFLDIGTARKGLAGTGNDDRLDLLIG